MIPIKQATGFFRFPARVTTRVVFQGAQVMRILPPDGDASRTTFRVQHRDANPAADDARDEHGPKIVPVRGPGARITWRF